MNSKFVTWMKEPLFQFSLIGCFIFSLYTVITPESKSDKLITVDQPTLTMLTSRFEKSWQRPPTTEELKGLVDDYVLEEIYYRKALELGIDKDDPMIRRRLRQKMEFYEESLFDEIRATDQQLMAFINEQPERYQHDARFTFKQIYFKPKSRAELEKQIAQLQSSLKQGTATGDSSMLADTFDSVTASEVDRTFGRGMADKLLDLPIGKWSEPVQSGLGTHLILISKVQPSSLPDLSEIRQQVHRDWLYSEQQKAKLAIRKRLLDEYEVEAPSLEAVEG